MSNFWKQAVSVSVIVTALGSPNVALAGLVSSIPEANATVPQGAAAGPQISLQFSEPVELNRSKFVVIGPKGHLTTTIGQDIYDKSLVFVSLWNQIFPGKYVVEWQELSSSNKNRSHGSFTFTVKFGPSEWSGIADTPSKKSK